ncbi:MAG: 50S ribosomal protein L15 [Acidobacteria bacterium]|nr:50S ribosomal protein L15 [Acidobacteriota bacterium]
MNLSSIQVPAGKTHARKRVGRGMGSGHGKTSTRGHKGQGSRSGTSNKRGFEGGQMPLKRRVPKRGFTNIFRKEYAIINLDRIAELKETVITPEFLLKTGVLSSLHDGLKVLGEGELKKAVTVSAHKFSESAKEKILKAGGKVEVIAG